MRLLRICWVAVAAVVALAGVGVPEARAQPLPPPVARAIEDSLRALDSLEHETRLNPLNAAAWYRSGRIAFHLSQLSRERSAARLVDEPRMYRVAREALARALEIEPDNPGHKYASVRFRLAYEGAAATFANEIAFRESLKHAPTREDSLEFAALAFARGRAQWIEYETFAERALAEFTETRNRTGAPGLADPKSVVDAAGAAGRYEVPIVMRAGVDSVLEVMWRTPFDVAGESGYVQATDWFRHAYAANPESAQTFREFVRALTAVELWDELRGVGQLRIERQRGDPWGWMALGLAHQRLRATAQARTAFDSAFARFDRRERMRLDRLDRVLAREGARQFQAADSAGRERLQATSWLMADPLWSVPDEDVRVEFFARVAFAEFRWSVAESGIRGADTPRGATYVRYGPPRQIIGVFWIYDRDLMFALSKGLTSQYLDDPDFIRDAQEWQPARWDNVARTRVDSLPVQAVRFRAAADSVDFFIAARVPVEELAAAAGVDAPGRVDLWLYGWNVPDARRDSLAPVPATSLRWTHRLPSGRYYYRIETTVPGGLSAARAAASITLGPDSVTGFATRGFGLSDVLLATTIEPVTGTARWTDLTFAPVTGQVAYGSTVTVAWETYELARRGEAAEYDVSVTIERDVPGRGRVAAVIASGLAAVAGLDQSANRVSARFERTVPHAAAFVDAVTISLGETPPGSYRLILEVRDRVTGARQSARARFIVVGERP